ncbi:MAG: sulfotransferase family 2 domain-containing protein [Candidatus Latescibacteria bacterium]|nr:sulfotransferase family 2 domain-containing protein [Candidatus Latescibacterota bacterium]
MLSQKYNCLFVHIPKTAGQSVEHVFLALSGLTRRTRASLLLRPNDDPDLGPPKLAHLKASEYVSCGYITSEEFDAYFKFSFVRNPWDRIVSEYRFRRHPRRFDFKTYLFEHLPKPGSKHHFHTMPQHEFLFDAEDNCLVDFVGRFECLQEDFDKVCSHLSVQQTLLPHLNKSRTHHNRRRRPKGYIRRLIEYRRERANSFDHYTEYYDEESREFVAKMYEKDIEIFKYEFEKTKISER